MRVKVLHQNQSTHSCTAAAREEGQVPTLALALPLPSPPPPPNITSNARTTLRIFSREMSLNSFIMYSRGVSSGSNSSVCITVRGGIGQGKGVGVTVLWQCVVLGGQDKGEHRFVWCGTLHPGCAAACMEHTACPRTHRHRAGAGADCGPGRESRVQTEEKCRDV